MPFNLTNKLSPPVLHARNEKKLHSSTTSCERTDSNENIFKLKVLPLIEEIPTICPCRRSIIPDKNVLVIYNENSLAFTHQWTLLALLHLQETVT